MSYPILEHGDVPPVYTIDLSLPPESRYVQLATDYKDRLLHVTSLFEEVITSFGLGSWFRTVQFIAPVLLRRVYDVEQTRELRGISAVTGLDMYLLVALNVLLDLFMGCTSGGAASEHGMLHFRTLDWGMDELRHVVVQLDYVERKGGPVVARSVTYVGFVGVLTGVRRGLSVSLNFRPTHDVTGRFTNLRYYAHHLLVLLGIQPSIASLLRGMILPSESTPTLDDLRSTFPSIPTTAAYLIMCDGRETLVMEKDRVTAHCRSSTAFVAATNHDVQHNDDEEASHHAPRVPAEFVLDSGERLGCIGRKWAIWTKTFGKPQVPVETLAQWICEYPTWNEYTHYATVMDPIAGTLPWVRRWQRPMAEYVEEFGLSALQGSGTGNV